MRRPRVPRSDRILRQWYPEIGSSSQRRKGWIRPPERLLRARVRGETTQVLGNIQVILQAAGASMKDVVRCVVYLKDIEDFPAMNEAYAAIFTSEPPARTTVGVAALPLGLKVMIEATLR